MTVRSLSTPMKDVLHLQVGHLGDGYQKWVHQSIVCKESPRFFQSDFMEVQILSPVLSDLFSSLTIRALSHCKTVGL